MRRGSYHHRGGAQPLLGIPIYTYLAAVATRFADREALISIEQGLRLTYAELFSRADALARGLLRLGLGRGSRIGIWATNNAEWVVLQIATARIGAVLVNINPAYRIAELEHALTAARVRTLVVMPAFRRSRYVDMVTRLVPEVATVAPHQLRAARLPELDQLIVFDPQAGDAVSRPHRGFHTWPEVIDYGRSVADAELAAASDRLDIDDPINIQFTSGTTGFPKPVVLSHHNILNNAFFGAEAMALTEDDRLCVPVPFYHCFGMVLSNLACLTHGAALVLPAAHFDPGATLRAIEAERCTALHGVPTMFVAEFEHPEFDRFDLSSLRTGIMAGAPCPPELMRRVMEEMGCREILIAYGQTESSPGTHITSRTDSIERRTQTVGRNMPHQEVKVIDPETGALAPLGQQGEICFRGYHVMKGYFELEDDTREVIDADGWLHSGDLGVMDDDGYVRITGRLKEMVIRGGENIYPAEIEYYLSRHPKVAQAAVFGVADARLGEELGAWVQLREGATATTEEIADYVRAGLAHFKVPRYIRIVDHFPMTVTGKIQKFRIREMVEAEIEKTA